MLDTLDERVDAASFTLIESSLEVGVDFRLSNDSVHVLRFSLEDLYLPSQDSLNDGYLRFAVRGREDVSVGDTITNRAAIYFDQNPPIITNVVRNRFIEISTPINNPDRPDIDLEIFPNPASDRIHLRSPDQIYQVRQLDLSGRLLQDYGPANELPLGRLPAGVYVLTVRTSVGTGTRRVVIR